MRSSNFASEYISEGNKINIPKRYLHPHFYCNIIYNSQGMKTTLVCIDRWINKEKVAYVQLNTIQRENEGYPAICNNMDRLWKGIMLNEMSLIKKHKKSMISLICEIYKKTNSLKQRMHCVLSLSVMSDSATPWTVAHQAPLSMGILQTRILEWIAMPSSRGSSQPKSPILQVEYLPVELPGKPRECIGGCQRQGVGWGNWVRVAKAQTSSYEINSLGAYNVSHS